MSRLALCDWLSEEVHVEVREARLSYQDSLLRLKRRLPSGNGMNIDITQCTPTCTYTTTASGGKGCPGEHVRRTRDLRRESRFEILSHFR